MATHLYVCRCEGEKGSLAGNSASGSQHPHIGKRARREKVSEYPEDDAEKDLGGWSLDPSGRVLPKQEPRAMQPGVPVRR